MSRRLPLPLVVVAACILAACVPVTAPPPPPPQPLSEYCAPAVPTTAGGYQAAFDNLRKTYTEWATADGAVPVRLPDGRTLWMFGDTYIGKVSASGAIPASAPLVSNSAVLQTGSCFKPLMGGKPLARSAWIADPHGDQAYWPASAVVDTAGNRLFVFLLHVQRPGTVIGTRVATFTLPTLGLASITSADLAGTSTARPYGSTAFTEGGYAYMYSTHGDADGAHHHVARAPISSARQQSTWQYWVDAGPGPGADDDTWSAPGNHAAAVEMGFSVTVEEDLATLDFGAPIAPLRVVRYGDGYLGTAMLVDGFTDRAISFTAPAPQGPWTYAGDLTTTPSDVRSYGAQTLVSSGGVPVPILAHSTNLLPGETAVTIKSYGFRFRSIILPPPFVATTSTEVPETSPTTELSTTTSTSTTTTSSTTPTTTSTTPP